MTLLHTRFQVSVLLFLSPGSTKSTPPHSGVHTAYGKLPLSFEPNRGQAASEVKFLSRGSGYTLLLTADEAVLGLRHRSSRAPSILRMKLLRANPAPNVEGIDALPGRSNYFIGPDPAAWRTGISHYARVAYRQVYPGVDLLYYGNGGRLEFDFVVSPGTDPGLIRLRFDGARRIRLERSGDLLLKAAPCGSGFATKLNTGDSALVYSTYLCSRTAHGIAVDAFGNAYTTGYAFSVLPPYDAFVKKLNPAGSALAYSVVLSGSGGTTLARASR